VCTMYVYEVQSGKTTTTTKTLQRQPFESVCYRQKHSYEFLNKQTLDKEVHLGHQKTMTLKI